MEVFPKYDVKGLKTRKKWKISEQKCNARVEIFSVIRKGKSKLSHLQLQK